MKRLVLVGGGHAHLHVLHALAASPSTDLEVVLISAHPVHHYSGMVPGFLQGTYAEADLTFDLARVASAARARLVVGFAESVDAAARTVLVDGERIDFDAASIDVGSEAAALDVPGAREHARTVRPMTRAVALRDAVDARIREREEIPIVVTGAGAAGFEVALALHRRVQSAGRRARVAIADPSAEVLPGYAPRVRRRARAILDARGIPLHLGHRVTRVEPDHVLLDDGTRLDSALTVWLAGAAPGTLLAASAVPKSPRGWLYVDDTLRAVGGAPLFGAGDCIELEHFPWVPKAGVYPVRQGPILAHNLRAFFAGGHPKRYRPQRTYLSLLNTADGKALLRGRLLVAHTAWAWRLKNRIDTHFMRRYQR